MTTQLLPSIVSSPFSSHFEFHGSDAALSVTPTIPATSFTPFFIHQDRQISSASLLSTTSAPVATNNENKPPLDGNTDIPLSSRSVSAHLSSKESKRRRHCDNGRTQQDDSSTSGRTPCVPKPPAIITVLQGSSDGAGIRRALQELPNEERWPTTPPSHARPLPGAHIEAAAPLTAGILPTSKRRQENPTTESVGETRAANLPCQPRYHQQAPFIPYASQHTQDSAENPYRSHTKRLSTASSAFVHTMKTASLSNASFTIVRRSSRIGRSTDSCGILTSLSRLSTDSDRPPTTSSVDEAAFRRGTKRRQILAELLTTEESYIADLKALIYLYSTLLATTMTGSSGIRASILRNVHDLLHTHERLLERLQQAAFDAAARKWADTTSCRHLGSPRHHKRCRSLESNFVVKYNRNHRQARSSIDSCEMTRGRAYLGCADPKDVADVAAIFKDFLNDFLVYEEYCANHSIIAHELQRHAPNLWSAYEAGIESLARSLIALDLKHQNERKGLTVGDLLIKPIQRVTKYPLLFDDLLKQTPVADCPSAHTEVEATLQCLREVVQTVNHATDNRETRTQVQRRWSLQSRLSYERVSLRAEQFRMLGNIQLCGVLHVTWQTRSRIGGCYGLCILFDSSLMVALPAGPASRFEVVAFIHLTDLTVECPSNGRGLQCHSALHTWKVSLQVNGHFHELILSACSAAEEEVWKAGMEGKAPGVKRTKALLTGIPSSIGLDLRSTGSVYGPQASSLSRHPSVQRAATVGNRANISQVIIRNTHNLHDFHDFRQPSSSSMNRSQSHMSSNRIVVLSPKRSERARLESALGDVWTKDKIAFPGMVGSRGGQIIRASAGTLVRKLSLASIHAPFSRRSGSLSLTSRKSFDGLPESRRARIKHSAPVFEVRKESFDELTPARKRSHDLPELDTMDSVISRMIGSHGAKRLSFSHADHGLVRKVTKSKKADHETITGVGPEVPAEIFYSEEKELVEKEEIVEEGLTGRKKRWSNPLGILRGLSAEGFRHMLYSSK
ncbi:hypothetical protein A1O1_04196 [Capronia coronata CBS 617.96]|uniref:DH domain-containing protein n=1 Tax=Capronia coronata CBS 617.96 TaxID=1182541 RepID=W9Z999_9EURO|nr:uncharacterized protein A1O1_04196 [Capronia coronata CBS 617.96]EXJ91089.1 hypothetical protein A1O1_04196 [Capronia coronata CBS 617.96]